MAGSLHSSDIKGLLSIFWSLHSCHLVGEGSRHEEVFNLPQKPWETPKKSRGRCSCYLFMRNPTPQPQHLQTFPQVWSEETGCDLIRHPATQGSASEVNESSSRKDFAREMQEVTVGARMESMRWFLFWFYSGHVSNKWANAGFVCSAQLSGKAVGSAEEHFI